MFKNRLTYGVVVFVLLLFVYLHESPMTYMALYGALVLPMLSFVFAVISNRRISISEKLNVDFISKEQVACYKIFIENRSFLPCNSLHIKFSGDDIALKVEPQEVYFSIAAFAKRGFDFQIKGIYRGVYEIGGEEIVLYDILGLFRFKRKYEKKLMLTVTPRIFSISTFEGDLLSREETISRNYFQGEDYSAISELRKYQPTDGYKKVHWKASAKRNELISKEFQEAEKCTTVFCIDNTYRGESREEDLKQEDQLMEAVVSVMSHCCRLGNLVSLYYENGGPVNFTTDFATLYREASKIIFKKEGQFEVLLSDYVGQRGNTTNLFVFTHNVNENLISILQQSRISGNSIVLFLLKATDDEAVKRMESLDIRCIYFAKLLSKV